MDRKSKMLVFFLVLLVAGALFFMYYKTFVLRDYIIRSEVDCDPYTEVCFVYTCDPDEEECTGNTTEDTFYYKIMRRQAKNAPECDPVSLEECDFTCRENEEGCIYEFCGAVPTEDVICIDPEQYANDHPIEEESDVDSSEEDTEIILRDEESGVEEQTDASTTANLKDSSE